MTNSSFAQHRGLVAVWKYFLAISSVGIATFLTVLLIPNIFNTPLLFGAILISSWFGGRGPGLLATVLAVLCLDYFIIPPQFTLSLNKSHASNLIVFGLFSLFFSWASASRKNAQELLQVSREDLEEEVRKRTAEIEMANKNLQTEIVERRKAEVSLRDQASLLDLTHDAIFVRDAGDLITYWNRGAYLAYGWTAEETVGKLTTHELLQTVFPAPLDKIDAELMTTGRWEGELVHTKRDGTHRVVASRWTLQRDESGNPLAVLETNNDITERKRAENEQMRSAEALRQAQDNLARVSRVTTMGELTASLAHEVNQPITAAVTNANTCVRWLARDEPNIEEACAAAARIVKDGTRAAEIISRIRRLFQKGSPERVWVDVEEIIREIIVLLNSEATRYSVSVRTEISASLPRVRGDRVQLQQVFMNLVLNGVDAMKNADQPRELLIKAEGRENAQVLISVHDSGSGLPVEADQIFEAFFTTKPQGTGMGLSISRSIIESHGGRLWAADNYPRGASFHFALPTNQEATE